MGSDAGEAAGLDAGGAGGTGAETALGAAGAGADGFDPPAAEAYFFLTSSADSLPVAMTARGAPTLALPPSGTRIAAIVPVSNDSLSMTALSVSISARTSPCLT